MVFEKRLKHDDIAHMDDSEYREVLRKELAKRRATNGSRNRSGEVMISVLLLIAAAVVVGHYFGIVQFPVK